MSGLDPTYPRSVRAAIIHSIENAAVPEYIPGIAGDMVPSDQPNEDMVDVGNIRPMRIWDGPRTRQRLRTVSVRVTPATYETGLDVSWEERTYHKIGRLQQRITDIGVEPARMQTRKVMELLELADQPVADALAYTGQSYFGSHVENGYQFTNWVDVNVVDPQNPTADEIKRCIFAAIERARLFPDDQGELVHEDVDGFFYVFIPPQWEEKARTALGASMIDNTTNILAGGVGGISFRLVVSGRLTSWNTARNTNGAQTATRMAVVRGRGRAMIRTQVGGVRTAFLGDGSDQAFNTEDHSYGIAVTRGFAFGNPRDAVQVQLY